MIIFHTVYLSFLFDIKHLATICNNSKTRNRFLYHLDNILTDVFRLWYLERVWKTQLIGWGEEVWVLKLNTTCFLKTLICEHLYYQNALKMDDSNQNMKYSISTYYVTQDENVALPFFFYKNLLCRLVMLRHFRTSPYHYILYTTCYRYSKSEQILQWIVD